MSEYIEVAEALARAVLNKPPTTEHDGLKGPYLACFWCGRTAGNDPDISHDHDCPVSLAEQLQRIGQ